MRSMTGPIIISAFFVVALFWYAIHDTKLNNSVKTKTASGQKLTPQEERRREKLAAEKAKADKIAAQQAAIVCPHCQQAGGVTRRAATRKKGISGGKATGALMTGGASMLATGLSRKEGAQECRCSNCGMKWDVA